MNTLNRIYRRTGMLFGERANGSLISWRRLVESSRNRSTTYWHINSLRSDIRWQRTAMSNSSSGTSRRKLVRSQGDRVQKQSAYRTASSSPCGLGPAGNGQREYYRVQESAGFVAPNKSLTSCPSSPLSTTKLNASKRSWTKYKRHCKENGPCVGACSR